MRVLFATSEIAPWVKTGGLGDVSAALPHALRNAGLDVRVLVPNYPALEEAFPGRRLLAEIPFPGGSLAPARLLGAESPAGLPLLLLDCPVYYARPGSPYVEAGGRDWPDNAVRFGLLSKVAALLASRHSPLSWQPDVLHCNDWQTGLAPAYLRYGLQQRAATLMAVHNVAFQGVFPAHAMPQVDLAWRAFVFDGVEYHGHLSFLKAGLQTADWISTVSPTYAREIQTPEFGYGLEGLLCHRAAQMTGILNGIDAALWDPASDRHLARQYGPDDLAGKAQNKRELQAHLGLPERADAPLFGAVSRLTHQKGLDMLVALADELVERDLQLVVVGTGEPGLEQSFAALSETHPEHIASFIGFDERLAHLTEAGADVFLMPSRFEPCGLNQMYSLRYGTPPVVRHTGGLADTVVDCTPQSLADDSASGFAFTEATPSALLGAIDRACAALGDPALWRRLQRNGMRRDFSWDTAAGQYAAIYERIVAQPPRA
jgi:starch synthase